MDAKFCVDEIEMELGHVQLVALLMHATLQSRRHWSSNGFVWRYRLLGRLAQTDEFARRVLGAVNSANREEVLALAEELMIHLGGIPDDGFILRLP